MHRLLKILIVCFVCLGGLPEFVQASTRSVTFINPGNNDGFWGNVTEVMHEASRQLDIQLEVLHSDRNRLKMIDHAEGIVSRATFPDVVIIVNELQQGSQLLNILGEARIPVYFLLNTLSHTQIAEVSQQIDVTPEIIGTIVPENFRAGHEMLMGLVQEAQLANSDKEISVLAILGDQLTPAALEREAGMRQAIEELDKVVLKRAFSVLWDPDVASKRVSTAMSLIKFDVIWAANDDLALASARAVASSCKDSTCRNTPIAGLNWSPEGIKGVKNGDIISSHGGHFTAGGYAIAAIYNYLNGKDSKVNITLLMDSIDSSNVDQFEKYLGSNSQWDKIDFKALSNAIDNTEDTFDPMSLFQYE